MSAEENEFHHPNIILKTNTRKEYAPEDYTPEHVITHVVSGELRFTRAEREMVAKAGETFLFRRNLLVKCEKRPAADERQFRIIYIVLEKEFLQQYAIKNNLQRPPKDQTHPDTIFLRSTPPLTGLLHSIYPYFDAGTKPSEAMKIQKLEETLLVLLEQQQVQEEDLGSWLFDPIQQGKIDLADFMQRNYKFNVPITKFAEFTGRSLSTFQRDFQKIFGTNPASWLLKRRLQAAHEAIAIQNKMPVDIYLDLGFEDIAHFSRTFKHEFGLTPSQLFKSSKLSA